MVDLGIVMISIPNSEVLYWFRWRNLGIFPWGELLRNRGQRIPERLHFNIWESQMLWRDRINCLKRVWWVFPTEKEGLGVERPERLLSRYFRRDKSLLFTLNLGQEISCGIPLLEWEKRYRTYFQCNCSRKQMDTWTTATKNRVLSATHTTLENVCLFVFLTM